MALGEIKRNSLHASDPNLAFLALEAASELESLLQDGTAKLHAVHELASRLGNSTEEVLETGFKKSLMDPRSMHVFSHAYMESKGEQLTTLEELAQKAWQISADLKNAGEETEKKDHIQMLRSFCVALSRILVSHRKAMRNSWTRSPDEE